MNLKQVVVINSDAEMGKGKMCAQVAHASLEAFLRTDNFKRESWLRWGAKKVVVKANLKELLEVAKKAGSLGITIAIIKDAGLTQIDPGTITAVGLGPDEEEIMDKLTGHLKLV